MEDGHNHGSSNIKLAFFLNLGFTIVEIIGGLMINSIAVLSDAVHDLGDSLSLGLAWFLGVYAEKEGNQNYTYGYRRYSLLAALINTVVLIVGSLIILYNAIPRLIEPQETSPVGMIGFAIFGIIVNGIAVLKTKDGKSLNEKVVSWHLLEDVLGWIAVLIAGIIMFFYDLPILDPILSIAITIYILYNVITYFKTTILLFLQAVPEDIDVNQVIDSFLKIDGVVSSHHTHIWSLDSEHHVLSTHLVVDKNQTIDQVVAIKQQARQAIEPFNIEHITIEIDFREEDCSLYKEKPSKEGLK